MSQHLLKQFVGINPQIPSKMLHQTKGKPGMSCFILTTMLHLSGTFLNRTNTISYAQQSRINPLFNKMEKPSIIEVNNSTKKERWMDTFDQTSTKMGSSWKTRRWPLCIFYRMLNIIVVNSCILFNPKSITKKEKPKAKKEFYTNWMFNLPNLGCTSFKL